MIVLDAAVVIALLDRDDAHHEYAEQLFTEHLDEDFTIGPISQAEVLVRPTKIGKREEVLDLMDELGISVTPLPEDAGPQLAMLRASSRARMSDCCVLLTALQTGGMLATYDVDLSKVALRFGIRQVGGV